MDTIAVLIPCYNKSKTIAKVVTNRNTALPDAVIYDYNSTDGTASLARAAGAAVRPACQQGKINVIQHLFREDDRHV